MYISKEQVDNNSEVVRVLEENLAEKYNHFSGERREHFKPECRGGYNYGMTVRLTWKSTEDMGAVASITNVLYDIADWPASGSIAWELRRFIRRASPEQTIEYGQLLLELVRRDGRELKKGVCFLGMDDLYWEADWAGGRAQVACQGEIDRLKRCYRLS